MTPAADQPGRSHSATVHDVAQLAGVSAQTVSRLISGYPGIRPVTRAKIEAAIVESGYRPNRAARLLRTGRSRRIGVVVHEMFSYGPARLLVGAGRRAAEHGYTLDIVGADGEDDDAVARAFSVFEEEQVAGILAVTLTDSVRRAVNGRVTDIPILVDPAEAERGGRSINELGGELVAQHLLELGHRRIGVIAGPEQWLPARQRLRGFLRTLEDAGVTATARWQGDWAVESGSDVAQRFDPSLGVTAIFAANDAEAVGLIHGLRRRGISVPDDVAVAGFDATPESAHLFPSVTTVEADYEGQGRIAVDTLLGIVRGEEPPATAIVPVRLLVRESTVPRPPSSRIS